MEKAALFIVDDDANIRYLLSAAAERAGVFQSLATFSDGEAALRAVQRAGRAGRPDLIVSDLCMPKMTGIELVRALKADPATQHIPIAIITSSDLPHDQEDALRAGAFAFHPKPYGLEPLVRLFTELWAACLATRSGTGVPVFAP